jgi:hypothetical protein
MKVTCIDHIPHRHLPDDFRSRYAESVVTTLFLELADPELAHPDMRNALDEAMLAARAAFGAMATTENGRLCRSARASGALP